MIIKNNELEVLRECKYRVTDIGMASDNAYLSIVATNNCNKSCIYCINSNTDRTINLDVEKALKNIKKLVGCYSVKEAVILGGEPTLHPKLFSLINGLKNVGLRRFGITTNGIVLYENQNYCKKLAKSGVSWINISSDTIKDAPKLYCIYQTIKGANPNCKVRINTNVYRGHSDTLEKLNETILFFSKCCDEMRVSNLIYKDGFSVNPVNHPDMKNIVPNDDEYDDLFGKYIRQESEKYTVIENPAALGFVRYYLIPSPTPVILNWNIGSKVSEQICENDIQNRKVNTFKCLVTGDISLSWNTNNIIRF